VVRLTGNETLALLARALEHIWFADIREWVVSHAADGSYPATTERRRELEQHERITELIAAGDGDGAAALMREHLHDGVVQAIAEPNARVDPKAVR
jgi:DNA-binding GntR family transcriptional regulator